MFFRGPLKKGIVRQSMRSVIAVLAITILTALYPVPQAIAEDLTSCRLGLSAVRAGKLDEALKLYDPCFNQGKLTLKSQPLWRYNRANIYLAKRRFQDAIRDYSEAIRQKPNYGLAYGSRGLAHEATGDKNAAMADFLMARKVGLRAAWLSDKLAEITN
jgi:tetratricopeptide (TPR) repeat protein